jgi:outer membrane protein
MYFFRSFVQSKLNKVNVVAFWVIVSLAVIQPLSTTAAQPVTHSVSAAMTPNFSELLERAAEFDADYREARYIWQAQQEQMQQSKSALLPSIQLNAGVGHHFEMENEPGSYNSTSYGISARQGLYQPQDRLAFQQSKMRVAQEKLRFEQAQTALITRLAEVFLDIYSINSEVQLIKTQQTAALQQLKEANLRFKVGAAGVNDTYEAQALIDSLAAQMNQLEHEGYIAQENVALIIGDIDFDLSHALDITTKTPSDFPLLAKPLQELVALALSNNQNFLIQDIETNITQKEIAIFKVAHLPTLDAVFNYQSSNSNNTQSSFQAQDASAVELQLTVPLYHGGLRSSKHKQAVAQSLGSQNRLQSIRRKVTLETSRAYYSIESAVRQKLALEKAIKSHQNAVLAARRGHQLGERSMTDVLNAQQQLFSTEHNLRLSHLNMLKSILSLYASVGQLNVDIAKTIFSRDAI